MSAVRAGGAGLARSLLGRRPVAAAVLLAFLAVVWATPRIARPRLEQALGNALGVPLHIAELEWRPLRGFVAAHGVAIGPAESRASIERLELDVHLRALLTGRIELDRVAIEGVSGAAEPAANGALRIAGIEIPPQATAPPQAANEAAPAAAPAPPRHIAIDALHIERVELTARGTAAAPLLDPTVRIEHLDADGIDVALDGSRIAARAALDGLLDGAPLHANAALAIEPEGTRLTVAGQIDELHVAKDRAALPPGLESLHLIAGATGELTVDTAKGSSTARADLKLEQIHVDGPSASTLSADRVALRGIAVDLTAHRVHVDGVEIGKPNARLALTPEGIAFPAPTASDEAAPPEAASGKPWSVTTGPIELRQGAVAVLEQEHELLTLQIEDARWNSFAPATAAPLAVKATLGTGGTLSLSGDAAIGPVAATVHAEVADLALPPLAELLVARGLVPLRLASGKGAATVDVAVSRDSLRATGSAVAETVQTLPPNPEHAEEVMSINRLEAAFDATLRPTVEVEVSSLKLTYPYVMVRRRAEGLFPLSVFVASSAPEATATALPPPPPSNAAASPPAKAHPALAAAGAIVQQVATATSAAAKIRVASLATDGGHIELVDSIVKPEYWTSLNDLRVTASDARLPEGTVARFEAAGKLDELSPLRATGRVDAKGLYAKAEVTRLDLPPLNPYITPALSYALTGGLLTVTTEVHLSRTQLEATNQLVLNRLALTPAGDDLFASQLGMPLTIALALMSDYDGKIALDVPLSGDPRSPQFSVAALVMQAVKRALLGLLQAPIKLLGSLFGIGGSPEAFSMDPIPFAPGVSALHADGAERIAQIAKVLVGHRGLDLVAKAQLAASDLPAARLDELRTRLAAGEPALEPLRPLLDAQAEASGAGKEAPAKADPGLEEQLVKQISFPAAGLAALGTARAEAVRQAFDAAAAQGKGEPPKVTLVPATPGSEAELDRAPGVYVELRAG